MLDLFNNKLIERAYNSTDPDYWKCYVNFWEFKLQSLAEDVETAHDMYLTEMEAFDLGNNVYNAGKLAGLDRVKRDAERDYVEYLRTLQNVVATLACFYKKNSIQEAVAPLRTICEANVNSLSDNVELSEYDWDSIVGELQITSQIPAGTLIKEL